MNSLLPITILAAVMTFCNFAETFQKNNEAEPASQPQTVKSTPKATPDKEALKSELLRLENEITDGALNGDITLLAKHTTDDFQLTGVDGKVQNKNEALADVKREKNIKSFSITDADLVSFSDDTAVLVYTQSVTLKTGQSARARVTDTFVKKDGRWLVKSEQQTLMRGNR